MPNDTGRVTLRCPLCGQPRAAEFRPFCSRGCRDRDLNRWFDGAYRVPANEPPATDGAADEEG